MIKKATKVLIFKQILIIITIENVWRTTWKLYTCIALNNKGTYEKDNTRMSTYAYAYLNIRIHAVRAYGTRMCRLLIFELHCMLILGLKSLLTLVSLSFHRGENMNQETG